MKVVITVLGLLFSVASIAQETQIFPVKAECNKTEDVVKYIKEKYQEYEFAVGDTGLVSAVDDKMYTGSLTMYLALNGTYSLLVHFSDGMSCMINAGKNFKPAPPTGDPS